MMMMMMMINLATSRGSYGETGLAEFCLNCARRNRRTPKWRVVEQGGRGGGGRVRRLLVGDGRRRRRRRRGGGGGHRSGLVADERRRHHLQLDLTSGAGRDEPRRLGHRQAVGERHAVGAENVIASVQRAAPSHAPTQSYSHRRRFTTAQRTQIIETPSEIVQQQFTGTSRQFQ